MSYSPYSKINLFKKDANRNDYHSNAIQLQHLSSSPKSELFKKIKLDMRNEHEYLLQQEDNCYLTYHSKDKYFPEGAEQSGTDFLRIDCTK